MAAARSLRRLIGTLAGPPSRLPRPPVVQRRRQQQHHRSLHSSPPRAPSERHPPPPGRARRAPSRSYISDMRKSAFEGNILRLLRNEIQCELERAPSAKPVDRFGPFTVDDRPGEQWIRLKRKFGGNEDINIEATMFDGAIPASKTAGGLGEDVELHISFVVNITKDKGSNVLEIMCSAWPDSIEINKLLVRGCQRMPSGLYTGPGFKSVIISICRELDDELQDALYDFLEERGVDDELAVFMHQYMANKDKTEFIKWMDTVKHFVEKKTI
ncbi:uncharacterized protein At2g39795, mitochondrial-like isoform X1 [Syzygium oleosum]|uniref:uncharacterized protein At2g39795, mitochondrial-like isoform X1 n=1 Tax=Syzygium oleosum TaxID=219896 RepID=UPI0024B99788|nr:uncharacterized protein At2g39795, mitochondrial-like isoform X1 [Syzygium oleosum]